MPVEFAEEDQVDQAALGNARDVLEQADIGIMAVDASPRLSPGGLDLGPRHVNCQMHLWLHCAHARYSITDPALRWRRTSRVNCTKAGSSVVATVRGRGRSTAISPTTRPGRGDITSTRSARNTASEML